MPKPPQAILDAIFAFSPNRHTLGATAYFIVENDGNILIDCPAFAEINLKFLTQQGGVRWMLITHRSAIGEVEKFHQALGCAVVIQEQEAYLLPEIPVQTFSETLALNSTTTTIWTPGHSPGSSCIYYQGNGGVLFTGRHLLPNQEGHPLPIKTSKTFHWPRQLKSVAKLQQLFSEETLHYLCPGANLGYLRGAKVIDSAMTKLLEINPENL